ncbi:hypothetical protein [Nocardia jinanensis]|nr:hypothetical protein [Nocardia jinanensis]
MADDPVVRDAVHHARHRIETVRGRGDAWGPSVITAERADAR